MIKLGNQWQKLASGILGCSYEFDTCTLFDLHEETSPPSLNYSISCMNFIIFVGICSYERRIDRS